MVRLANFRTVSLAGLLAFSPAQAQVITHVSTAAELATALYAAQQAGASQTNVITLTGNISATAQMMVNANVVINGGGFTIDMNNADRAFFIAGGNVAINNLTIANGFAQGGAGTDGGGGGAGLGGAIFVANGSAISGANVTMPTVVTLGGVNFTNNSASGGNGGTITVSGAGGGGGMGGNGGAAHAGDLDDTGGGGGGGFGVGADGGTNAAGFAGAFLGGASAGTSGSDFAGGTNGGGGGGANGDGTPYSGSNKGGGGGGVAGGAAPSGGAGGQGGFGGGGGGSGLGGNVGGDGGFGGGGGGGNWVSTGSGTKGGHGGFGGGGGFGYTDNGGGIGGIGGFGGGLAASANIDPPGLARYGGGGLGAGGAIFVMDGASLIIQSGTFGGNTVTAGLGSPDNNPDYAADNSQNGSAYGADLFLGADVTFNVAPGQSISLNSLGGAGNLADPNVSGAPSGQLAQADGGVIKTGAGNLILTGTNYYSGATTVHQGTLTLAAGAIGQGTSSVVVGPNAGDNGTLVLSGGSVLRGQGTLLLGGQAPILGASGTLVFAGDSLATLDGFSTIAAGNANGTVQFAPSAGSTFTFDTSRITGGTTVVQNGPGTTIIQPPSNMTGTFGGSVFVMQGTLQIGTANAIGFLNPIFIQGGTLDLYQSNLSQRELFLSEGGSIIASDGYPLLELDFLSTASGTIAVSLNCGSDFQLTQDGAGTTVLTGNNLVQDSIINIEQGELLVAKQGGQLRNAAAINITGNGSLNIEGGMGAGLNAVLSGAQAVVVGKNSGDSASMQIDGELTGGGSLTLGQSSGSFGTVTVGASATRFEFTSITGGVGGGELIFGPAALGTLAVTNLNVNAQITGNVSLTVDAPGTVHLQPLNGQYAGLNTFTGPITINGGTLATAIIGSIESTNALTVNSGGTLQLNGNQTLSSISGNGAIQLGSWSLATGNSDSTFAGTIAGANGTLNKTGAGKLALNGTNTYTGVTTVSAGLLAVNGSITSDVTVQSGGTLGGSGTVGAISGAGAVGPGNSPGILTAPSVDPTGGLTFNYEFTGLNPDFSNASASVNDLLRLTSESPFTFALNNANAVNIYFNISDLGAGLYTGGFFTDTPSDFLSQIVNATFTYYLADESGTVSYNGVNYRALDAGYTVNLSTVVQRADFSGGTVNGQVAQFQVVPEPSTYALLALAASALGVRWFRRRHGKV
jgi:fibronectin-binding autotransporter adhesin